MAKVRMDLEQLQKLTGRKNRSAQARWFKAHFGVDVPCDQAGPIMTEQTYQDLLAKQCGLYSGPQAQPAVRRPTVRNAR